MKFKNLTDGRSGAIVSIKFVVGLIVLQKSCEELIAMRNYKIKQRMPLDRNEHTITKAKIIERVKFNLGLYGDSFCDMENGADENEIAEAEKLINKFFKGEIL